MIEGIGAVAPMNHALKYQSGMMTPYLLTEDEFKVSIIPWK